MNAEHKRWNTRALAIASDVRRRIERRALASVRSQLEAAGGTWADHAEKARTAVGAFLATDGSRYVLLYAASSECAPGVYAGVPDVGFPRAVRQAVRRIGALLPSGAAVAGLDAVAASLGEDSPVVRRLRAKG